MKLSHLFAASLLFVSFGSQAALVHQYRFDGSLADDQGGPSLVSMGGTVTGGRYVFAMNEGLALNENLGGQYTLDFMYNFSDQSSYRKLVDFAGGASDTGLYSLAGMLDLYTPPSNSAMTGAMTNNVDSQVTLTRDASGLMNGYVNQQLVLTYNDAGGAFAFGSMARFFMDDGVTGGEASGGQVDFLRIYNSALTANQVAALAGPRAPVNNNVPEPASTALVLAGIGMLALGRRRQRVR
jgi:hypothetical protein